MPRDLSYARPAAPVAAGPIVISISAAGDGTAWAVDKSATLLRNIGGAVPWEPVPVGEPLSQVAAQNAATVWGLDSAGYLFKFTRGPSGWTSASQHINLAWISVSPDGALWGASPQGDVVGFDPAEKVWVPVGRPVSDGRVVQVSSAGYELVMALCETGNLYRWTWNGFEPAAAGLPVGVSSVSVLPGGAAYAVGADHQLYLYQGTWLPAGGQVEQVSANAPDEVWCIDLAGNPVHIGKEHTTTKAHAGMPRQWRMPAGTAALVSWR
jgi:hypothetical protein